jgi:RNA recognition motif-containing protein
MKNLFVGNLPYSATEEALRDLFAPFGEVGQVKILTDRTTGKPRGFAFVEMGQDEDAQKAIGALNGRDFGGRALNVNEARPRPARDGGFSSGGGYGNKRKGSQDDHRGFGRQPREPRW